MTAGTFAVVIPADPTEPARIEPWPADTDVTAVLARLYAWIGTGTVDRARLDVAHPAPGVNELTLWIDDGGLYADPIVWNDRATVLSQAAGRITDSLAGTVVVTAGADDDGDTLGLPRDVAEHLLAAMPLLALLNPDGAWV